MIKPLVVPVIPNSPLKKKNQRTTNGKILLRYNKKIDMIENGYFRHELIKYDQNYQNDQSKSLIFQKHMKFIYEVLKRKFKKGKKVVEVGCGKGEFLSILKKDKFFFYEGYDSTYEGNDKKIVKRYLNSNDKIKTDVVVLRHVLEHIPNPFNFLNKIKKIFGSVFILIEVPNYTWIKKNNAFYDITYEHVNYFSKKSLRLIFNNNYTSSELCFNEQYQYILANLKDLSFNFKKEYQKKTNWQKLNFNNLFPKVKRQIDKFDKLSKNYENIYIWGAATKGCMFLVHCLIQKKLIGKVKNAIDINRSKCGKYLPMSKIKIISKYNFFKLVNQKKDLLIVSNPNYISEINNDLKKNKLTSLKIISL